MDSRGAIAHLNFRYILSSGVGKPIRASYPTIPWLAFISCFLVHISVEDYRLTQATQYSVLFVSISVLVDSSEA